MRVGVLAVQGDFAAHKAALDRLGNQATEVRQPSDLDGLKALILPGGESSAHLKILKESGLYHAIPEFHAGGGALFGTCAGLILLARHVLNPGQESLALIDIDVLRNGYGRQVDSFEAEARGESSEFGNGGPLRMVFIRAPRISRVGDDARILVKCEAEPVAALEGRVLVTAFHPELTEDVRLHRYFLEHVVLRENAASMESGRADGHALPGKIPPSLPRDRELLPDGAPQ